MTNRQIKTFQTKVVATVMTGIGMGEGISFSECHKLIEWLCGHPVWTHEVAHGPTREEWTTEGYEQFPNMPTPDEAKADYAAAAAKAIAAYGETVDVMQGENKRHESPIDTLKAIKPDAKIVEI